MLGTRGRMRGTAHSFIWTYLKTSAFPCYRGRTLLFENDYVTLIMWSSISLECSVAYLSPAMVAYSNFCSVVLTKPSQQYNFSIKLCFEYANSEFCSELHPKAARMERIHKWNREGEKCNHFWDILQLLLSKYTFNFLL